MFLDVFPGNLHTLSEVIEAFLQIVKRCLSDFFHPLRNNFGALLKSQISQVQVFQRLLDDPINLSLGKLQQLLTLQQQIIKQPLNLLLNLFDGLNGLVHDHVDQLQRMFQQVTRFSLWDKLIPLDFMDQVELRVQKIILDG
uniref:(northern house mosquito) hypothetical protein n=1 Tax=Culex pipiens TaxID=7175 RepID=A0A8D7ZV01_CULPI